MRGLFITGTDTGAGKSILTASLVAAMSAAGEPVVAHKPAVTGLDDAPGAPGWPPDHELLGLAAAMDPADVSPLLFGPAVSPHLAARLAGVRIDPARIVAEARMRAGLGTLVVEGIGGLLVPLTDDFTVRDLAVELGLPVIVAARPGLGTINHSLLTIESARGAGLDVAAIVLTPWPEQPSEMELSNRESVASLGEVQVQTLPEVPRAGRAALAQAGEGLPWREWLAAG